MAALSTPFIRGKYFERELVTVSHSPIRQYLTFTELVRTYNGVRLFVPDQLIGLFSVLLIGCKVLAQVNSNW